MAALELVKTNTLTRDEWLQARKKGIGGSDIAAIAGLSPWRSPMAVYLEKIGEIPDQEENEAMYWGTKLEDIVAEEFALRTGMKVQRVNAILQHPENPWMLANIDRRIVGQKAGLECKTTSAYGRDQWEDEKVPDVYMLQCQWYMAVTGYQSWWIAVLIGGNTFRYKDIQRDEDIIAYITQIGRDFWTLVENRTPPAIDGSDSSAEVLSVLYPADKAIEEEIDLPNDAESFVTEFTHAQNMESHWKSKKDEAANKLKALLGEKTVGLTFAHKVCWKPVTSTRVDTDALKKAGLYEKYSKSSSTRRFTVKEIKEA
jgi:putative phage-type endonuclease